MSCNSSNDGDASTCATDPKSVQDTGSLSPAYGDTTLNHGPSIGTDTSSRSYSGGGTNFRPGKAKTISIVSFLVSLLSSMR